MGLGGVVAVSAAGGVPCVLGLEGDETPLAGSALVGVEVGGGEAGAEFAEFLALALDRPVGVESGGDEQVGEVECAEAVAVVVALDVAEDGDIAQSLGQGVAVAGVDGVSRGVQRGDGNRVVGLSAALSSALSAAPSGCRRRCRARCRRGRRRAVGGAVGGAVGLSAGCRRRCRARCRR